MMLFLLTSHAYAGSGAAWFLLMNSFGSHSSSYSRDLDFELAEARARQYIRIRDEALRICGIAVRKDASWKRVKFYSSIVNIDNSDGGFVFKIIDPHDETEDYGYILWAMDNTTGSNNTWRIIIWENNEKDFNAHCNGTPFYYYATTNGITGHAYR